MEITYGSPFAANTATGGVSGASIATGSEVTLFTVTDPKGLTHSQLVLFINLVLASASKVSFGVYFSMKAAPAAGDWYKMSVEDLTTNKGDMVDIPPYVDGNSPQPVTASTVQTYIPIQVPSCVSMKITATAATGNAGAWTVIPAFRNN